MSVWHWLLIAGALAFAAVFHLYIFKRYHYVCSKCAKAFKPATFLRSMFALNGGDCRKMRCPHCGAKDRMKAEKD